MTELYIPHLTTAITGPLRHLEKHIIEYQIIIEKWFRKAWEQTPAPIYSSVDLRNAGFKLAPIDTNLFAAGFNNLNQDFMPLCIQAAKNTLEKRFPHCEKILLIPENHTSNIGYFENLAVIQNILIKAGYDTQIGSLLPELSQAKQIELPSGRKITLHPIIREQNYLKLASFEPCIILLNNDLSEGTPDIFNEIKQPIIPPVELGWRNRLKSQHFTHYDTIIAEFSELINIDPWLINPLFRQCGDIDFMTREGETCLTDNIELLLKNIQRKYQQYGITETPFVIVKADAGTYGMGVMTVRTPEDILSLNRKQRNKMSATKGKQNVSHVIIQEGVPSFETVGEEQAIAEPVIYLIGSHVVGGFYRVHRDKSSYESLNAPGSHFEALAFADCCANPSLRGHETPNRFYAYGVVARLAALAAAKEKQEVVK
ncbi:MAG: glutamate--cysteine ligase [Legionellales bacterium]|nr:glutamate--cysteine ligase [Legionellales bacterium]